MKKTLEQLREQRATLEKQLALLKHKLLEKTRKEDTRRKIIIGGFFLKEIEKNSELGQQTLMDINNFLTHDRDRELFGFSPKICAQDDVSPVLEQAQAKKTKKENPEKISKKTTSFTTRGKNGKKKETSKK